jgi:SM-20-related protein
MDVAAIAAELRADGFATVENALSPDVRAALDDACREGASFAPASVGRGSQRTHHTSIRGDVIRWLDDTRPADRSFLAMMEELRLGLNQQLFLGLLHFEGHYAVYEVGAHYDRHQDTLSGPKNRVLSTVVYLNDEWVPADGGELLLYRPGAPSPIATILPTSGLMVLFLSEDFPHEVLPATKPRHSIAGWFRGRAPGRE